MYNDNMLDQKIGFISRMANDNILQIIENRATSNDQSIPTYAFIK